MSKFDYSKVFYSIDHRKKLAKDMGLDEQEVLDLPKRELHTLWVGFEAGKKKAAAEIKEAFFCVPIDIWNHKLIQFQQVIQAAVDEMNEANEKSAENTQD